MTLTSPMDPVVKQQWIDALRSGEFEQAQSVLNTNGAYCCLGVLCELAIRAGVPVVKAINPDQDCDVPVWHYDGEAAYPPPSVTAWAGLEVSNPVVSERRTQPCACGYEGCTNIIEPEMTLSCLNDNGSTFDEIADVIAERL